MNAVEVESSGLRLSISIGLRLGIVFWLSPLQMLDAEFYLPG